MLYVAEERVLPASVSARDQAGIESKIEPSDNPEFSKVRVSGIDQEIAFRWNDCRRYPQEAAVGRVEPCVSESLQRSRSRVLPPSARQVSQSKFGNFDTLRDEDLERHEIIREQIGVAMDEHFEPGKRERLRRISNQTTSGMPASGNEEAASAVKR
jgi:hypothetical protein